MGKKKLQNELIASYLKQKTGNECVVRTHIQHIPKDITKNPSRPGLVILNCHGKNLKRSLNELKSNNLLEQSQMRIVLVNVSSDRGFQKKFVLDGIHGFFYENDPIDIFLKGVRAILDGKLWLSREMMTKCIFEGTGKDKLSKIDGRELTDLARRGFCDVDLVFLDTKDIVLKYEAVRQNRLIYAAHDFDRGSMYSKVIRQYLDFEPYLKTQRKAYKRRIERVSTGSHSKAIEQTG